MPEIGELSSYLYEALNTYEGKYRPQSLISLL